MGQGGIRIVPGDVARDSAMNPGSENGKSRMGIKYYIVALPLFRGFGCPFVLDRRQGTHENPAKTVSLGGHNIHGLFPTSKLAVATKTVPMEDLFIHYPASRLGEGHSESRTSHAEFAKFRTIYLGHSFLVQNFGKCCQSWKMRRSILREKKLKNLTSRAIVGQESIRYRTPWPPW